MKFIKQFENNNIPWKYKEIVRKCIDEIKINIDMLDPYHEKILNLIPTNKTLYFNSGSTILRDSDFTKNYIYILNNIKSFFNSVAMNDFRGKVAELIVEDLLTSKFNLNVNSNPTKQQNIDGADLITIGNRVLIHQVKALYDYIDNKETKTIKIVNRKIDIKRTDKYNYLWFFVDDKKEVVGFNKKDINIEQTNFGYIINYTKIEKYEISDSVIDSCKEYAKSLIQGFDDIIDSNYDALSLLIYTDKYNL